jgi:myo-inositol-1(or 4)-monophosphatase
LSLDNYDYEDLMAIQEIIRSASASSLAIYYQRSTADYKSDGSIVTEADLAMQQALTTALAERYPGVAMLGEEISEATQLEVINSSDDYWCLDPVDGTTNFHATVPLFSISLGLISAGEVKLGIVYDPNRDEFFSAIKGQGLWINGARVAAPDQPHELGNCIAFIDFKRLTDAISTSLVLDTPYKSQRNIGTCALECCCTVASASGIILPVYYWSRKPAVDAKLLTPSRSSSRPWYRAR